AAYHVVPGTTGPVIAIVDAFGYPNAEQDLAVYRSTYGLPPCTTANGCFKKVNQTGGTRYPKTDLGWALGQAPDLEQVSASCPGCKILLVEAGTNSWRNIAAAVSQAASGGPFGISPRAISNSYGGAEAGTTPYNITYCNYPSIAITVSSGDNGYAAGPQ